jgi:hypothetical protein
MRGGAGAVGIAGFDLDPFLPGGIDVAEAILFICSDGASCITGVSLPIDAGWLAASAYRSWAVQPQPE